MGLTSLPRLLSRPQAACFAGLATALTTHPPPEDQRLALLNDAWRVVTHTENPSVYADCVAAFIGMLLKHYSVGAGGWRALVRGARLTLVPPRLHGRPGVQEREIVILLRDCANRMTTAAAAAVEAARDDDGGDEAKADGGVEKPKTLPASAEAGINRVINLLLDEGSHIDFGLIFTSDPFVQLLDLFKPDQKAAVSKRLLEFFTKTQKPTNDPVVIHMYAAAPSGGVTDVRVRCLTGVAHPRLLWRAHGCRLFDVARTLHDSLDSLSVVDERKQVSKLICRFIDKVSRQGLGARRGMHHLC